MRRRYGGLVVAVLALGLVTGCGANGAQDATAPAVGGAGRGNAGVPEQAEQPRAESEPAPADPVSADSARQDRQLVRTAELEVVGEDVEGTTARVKDVVLGEGGFSGEESSTRRGSRVVLMVPAARLDAVLASIDAIGGADVTSRTVRAEDVTDEVVDVQARLESQRASVERVRALFERATTTSEITEIEGELTTRQAALESLQRRYDGLRDRVAMSTLTVEVRRESVAVVPERAGFLSALGDGWGAFLDVLRWLSVALGASLPFLVVLGVPAAVVVRVRRRRKAVTPVG